MLEELKEVMIVSHEVVNINKEIGPIKNNQMENMKLKSSK